MSIADLIEIVADGRRVPVQVENVATVASPHTGRELYNVRGTVHNTSEESHRWFLELLKNQPADGLPSPETMGSPARQWKLQLRTWSQSGARYQYIVDLQEAEMFNVETLVLRDIEVHPYDYKERLEGGLRIDAKIKLSLEMKERFLDLLKGGGYFPVIRRGIQAEPREMRFGAVYWSAHEDVTKYDLVLVERTPADEAPTTPWDLPGESARAYLAFEIALRRELFALLKDKGVLSEEEIANLRERAEQQEWLVRNEFFRVKDVDMLP